MAANNASALSAKVFRSNTWTEGETRSFSPSIWSAYSLPSQGMAGRKIIGSDILDHGWSMEEQFN
ncbi:UNVERIFIED_ORG: hypothetical protein ABIC62_006582 [Burkholderia sp. 1595]|uniref:Uncharacterized protein n=1 Tax=Paraburkholderia terricola TaxID=169427 RepID=A0ABU1M289_9BURK|nr:hypothetical protein [Paraburkholderia terricola]MDR6413139.1 hypothetical protein [Paraburkholderia terricola]